jgi:hypothetical protein
MLDVQEKTQTDPISEAPAQAQNHHIAPIAQRPNRGIMWGLGLTLFGALALLASVTDAPIAGLAILPTLAVVFLISGILTRSPHLLVPGGILGGLGVGTVLAYALEGRLAPDAIGGLVVLCLGLGFLLIVALQALVAKYTHWWPLVPAGLLMLIGSTLLFGGSTSLIMQALGYLWPLALLACGIWILARALRRSSEDRSHGTPDPL